MQIKHGIYGVVISLALSAAAWADEVPKVGCAAKLEAISAELAQAKAAGNKHKSMGSKRPITKSQPIVTMTVYMPSASLKLRP